jgi:hypothetical protein
MPDDVDRSLVRLAVDHGFLTRDEAMRYWQQIQAPGSPRFVQLLMQSGRLSKPDVDRLRSLWQQQSGQPPSGVMPSLPPPAVAVAPPQVAAPPANGGSQPGSTDDGSWEEALEKDTQLARLLIGRGLVTQERLRECRQLQLQHRMRLGVVLVKKNYVERAAVDEALRSLKAAPLSQQPQQAQQPPLSASVRMSAPQGPPSASYARPTAPSPGASGQMPRPGGPATNPFAPTPGLIDQDAMPTLNVPPGSFPPGGPFSPPGRPLGPQDAIPTLLGTPSEVSVEELNPFAIAGPQLGNVGGPAAGRPQPGAKTTGAPRGLDQGALSLDELNAFDDVPLGPPPSSPGASIPLPGSNEDMITMPPSYGAPDGFGPVPAPPPSAQGLDALPDSGGERLAAPKTKKTGLKKAEGAGAKSGGGGGAKLLIFFVVGALLVAAAAAAYLYFA